MRPLPRPGCACLHMFRQSAFADAFADAFAATIVVSPSSPIAGKRLKLDSKAQGGTSCCNRSMLYYNPQASGYHKPVAIKAKAAHICFGKLGCTHMWGLCCPSHVSHLSACSKAQTAGEAYTRCPGPGTAHSLRDGCGRIRQWQELIAAFSDRRTLLALRSHKHRCKLYPDSVFYIVSQ